MLVQKTSFIHPSNHSLKLQGVQGSWCYRGVFYDSPVVSKLLTGSQPRTRRVLQVTQQVTTTLHNTLTTHNLPYSDPVLNQLISTDYPIENPYVIWLSRRKWILWSPRLQLRKALFLRSGELHGVDEVSIL
jgi:hypothetical protein